MGGRKCGVVAAAALVLDRFEAAGEGGHGLLYGSQSGGSLLGGLFHAALNFREDVGKLDHPGGCGRCPEVPDERLNRPPHRPG